MSFQDTLWIRPCTLDGRVRAADGPANSYRLTSVLLGMLLSQFVLPVCLVAGLLLPVGVAFAATLQVSPDGEPLGSVLARARDGDTVRLAAGVYRGNLTVDHSIRLIGQPGAILDAQGRGDALRVRAPDVLIRGLEIRNSGHDLTAMNAGIFVEASAANVEIRDNDLDGNAFGIWLDGCPAPRVIANRIHGEPGRRSQDRGNGIHLYAVRNGLVADNEVWETRDGIYIDSSQDNRLLANVLHDLRYGIHYMYSYRNQVTGNRTYRTRTGYALMQSRHLTVTGNRSEDDGNYGILLNYITYSRIADNNVTATRQGQAYVTGGADVIGAEGKARPLWLVNAAVAALTAVQLRWGDLGARGGD